MYFGILAFSIVFATGFYWFRLVYTVALPKNRTGFLVSMLTGTVVGAVALMHGSGIINGIFSVLSILLGGVFVFTWLISAQKGGSEHLTPGAPLLSFSAPDHLGVTFDSSTLDGRPVLLKFFRGHW